MMDKELREILEELVRDATKEWIRIQEGYNPQINGKVDIAISNIKEMWEGQILYIDLCDRLIKHILKFNPNEHDIELNLCGIIEKAKREKEKNEIYDKKEKM
jgi:hypothetical protein